MTFNIAKAVRKGAPPLIANWGASGSGKTYSSILEARGLVGDEGKIVLIDTENGRSLFYDDLAGGWDHLDFPPPYTPARYIEAMAAAEDAGADVVIIDSISHAWAGTGGSLDMADASSARGMSKWQRPKLEFRRMADRLFHSPLPVIFCLRAKNLSVQEGNAIIEKGLTPVVEKSFIYEMTVSCLIGSDHVPVFGPSDKVHTAPTVPYVKVPAGAASAIKRGVPIGIETGKALAEWVAGGEPLDEDLQRWKAESRAMAALGTERFREHWRQLQPEIQEALRPMAEELKGAAKAADSLMAEHDEQEDDDGEA